MNEMRAAQYGSYGPSEVLQVRTVPVPRVKPGDGHRVAATSVNGADTAVRAGKLQLMSGRSFPRGAGFDFAGTVAEAASDVSGLAAGDEVWGFVNAVRNPPRALRHGRRVRPATTHHYQHPPPGPGRPVPATRSVHSLVISTRLDRRIGISVNLPAHANRAA